MAARRPPLSEVDGDPIFVTPMEAAGILRLAPNAVRDLASQGELGPRKYIGKGRQYRLFYAEVKAWAESLPEERDED